MNVARLGMLARVGALAATVLAVVGCAARSPAGPAVAVLEVRGADPAEQRAWQERVASLARARRLEVIAADSYWLMARRLGAQALTAPNVARVARAIGATAVVHGRLDRGADPVRRRGKRRHRARRPREVVTIYVRDGESGRVVEKHRVRTGRGRVARRSEAALDRTLLAAVKVPEAPVAEPDAVPAPPEAVPSTAAATVEIPAARPGSTRRGSRARRRSEARKERRAKPIAKVAAKKPTVAAPAKVAVKKPSVAAPAKVAVKKPSVAAPAKVAAKKPTVAAPAKVAVKVAAKKPTVAAPAKVAAKKPSVAASASAAARPAAPPVRYDQDGQAIDDERPPPPPR